MAKKAANGGNGGATDPGVNLDACFRILAATQDQIRFADTKAAFLFGINTLLFGFVAATVGVLKRALTTAPVPPAAWVSLVALIGFVVLAAVAVVTLISVVMSRFGELAPKSRLFFGHILKHFGKDYGKYVGEVTKRTEEEWAEEVGTQIVEVSHIALMKHQLVKRAALLTMIGFACWLVSVFSSSLIP
jgi:Pycsar effector protein